MSGVTYIVIVAVEDYNEADDFPKVDFAKKDAEDLIEAFKGLGFEDDDFVILINEKATRAAIMQKVKKVCDRALENDRIIFYFAGHGFYEGGHNLLGSVDAVKTAKPDTCVPMNEILKSLKKSSSKQKILFLDCCHSGVEIGSSERKGIDSFEADELIYMFSKEEYLVGFASCKTNQTSNSHARLKNGVWSHFLIQALKGDAKGLYEKNLLFSDNLQKHLNKNTAEFVKLNTVDKKDQTPIKFGSETDRFIIADLNPLFEMRERSRRVSAISFTNISMVGEESGKVVRLPGFRKGSHKAPGSINSSANSFIQKIGADIVNDEISEISDKLRTAFKYKRVEMRAGSEGGYGSIETPDFDYVVTISQSDEEPEEYVVKRSLLSIKNQNMINDENFNAIFSEHFDNLQFELETDTDIEWLIDQIEEMEDSPVSVKYDPSDLSSCTISLDNLDYDIRVEADTISITTNYFTSPGRLAEAFKQSYRALQGVPELKLLN